MITQDKVGRTPTRDLMPLATLNRSRMNRLLAEAEAMRNGGLRLAAYWMEQAALSGEWPVFHIAGGNGQELFRGYPSRVIRKD